MCDLGTVIDRNIDDEMEADRLDDKVFGPRKRTAAAAAATDSPAPAAPVAKEDESLLAQLEQMRAERDKARAKLEKAQAVHVQNMMVMMMAKVQMSYTCSKADRLKKERNAAVERAERAERRHATTPTAAAAPAAPAAAPIAE